MIVMVTGLAGYIGGQIGLKLKARGMMVIGVDQQPLPTHLEGQFAHFEQCDFDSEEFRKLMMELKPDAVIHCAGTSLVGPSMLDPQEYYMNNVVKTIRLLNDIKDRYFWKPKFIFSSSAATYGTPVMTPCQEIDPCEPISPYGESKLFIEQVLRGYHKAYGLKYVAFRFFNACSADPEARHGQKASATHIIARVLESIRDNTDFVIYGNDYPTEDGTCVRDYIHVDDIADAHVRALDVGLTSGLYNLGNKQGVSNLEIVRMAEKVTGRRVTLGYGAQRAGDPAQLTADADKFNSATGWAPKYTLEDMVRHAWAWYNNSNHA